MDENIKIGAGADEAFDFQKIMEFNGGKTPHTHKADKVQKPEKTGKETRRDNTGASEIIVPSASDLRRVRLSFPGEYLPWMRFLADDRGQTLSNYLFDLFLEDFNAKKNNLEDKLKLKL